MVLPLNETIIEAIANQTGLSFWLAKHVISTHAEDKNLVFSPLSLHVILALIASGSNAPTRDQLLGFLRSNSMEELNSLSSEVATVVLADGEPLGGPRLSSASGVWVDRRVGLKESFKQIVEKYYMATPTHVDFQNKVDEVIEEVNSWADHKTNGLIKEILAPNSVDASTIFILANAVYFKGAWDKKFDASLTKDHDFFLLNGTNSVKAPFMTSKKMQYYIRAFDGFTMLMFLPDAKDGLPHLIEKISSTPGFIQQHLPYGKKRVNDFRIPKFKISFDFEASEVLEALGVVLPFTLGGLSETVDDPSVGKLVCVDGIFHKSFIEVNEEGTEAAAVTFAGAFGSGLPPPAVDFVGTCLLSEKISAGLSSSLANCLIPSLLLLLNAS